MSVRVFAAAKINLTLEVGAPRADGLHPLQSVVTFADIGDVLEAGEAEAITLSLSGPFADALGAGEDNLVLRAARALASATGATQGAVIALEKNLPIASGIGGGSADAAAALRALNTLWGLNLSVSELAGIARPLGADVPICVASAPAYMTGVGADWSPLSLCDLAAVLINPLQPLPTASVYQRFDALELGVAFTERAPPVLSTRAALLAEMTRAGNDLYAPARALAPVLDVVEAALRNGGAAFVGLSGSGATMFGIFDTGDAAEAAADTLQAAYPNWWVADTRLAGA